MNPDATPEDEAFDELEQRLLEQRVHRYIQRAQMEAARFVQDYQAHLGIMTLRKAYELGYRHACSDKHAEDQHLPTKDHES